MRYHRKQPPITKEAWLRMFGKLRAVFIFSHWLCMAAIIFLFVFFLILGLATMGIPWRHLAPFAGTFSGTFLAFIMALILEGRREQRQREERASEEKRELRKAIDLIRREVADNGILCEKIGEYLDKVGSLSDQELQSREKDPLFYRLQTSSKAAVWKKLLEGVNELETIADIGVLYWDIICCNNLLDQTSHLITVSLRSGSTYRDYKMALGASPWRNQLPNLLSRIVARTEDVEKGLDKIREGEK